MKEKPAVKAREELTHYAKKGERGKVKDVWNEKLSGMRMRSVIFKNGGYAVFGDIAFDKLLEILK